MTTKLDWTEANEDAGPWGEVSLVIDTDSYSGNFERELLVACTGVMPEHPTGITEQVAAEFPVAEPMENIIGRIPRHNGRALARVARVVGHDTLLPHVRWYAGTGGWPVPGCGASWPEGHCYAPSTTGREAVYVCADCVDRPLWRAEDYGRAYHEVPDHDRLARGGAPYRPRRPGVAETSTTYYDHELATQQRPSVVPAREPWVPSRSERARVEALRRGQR